MTGITLRTSITALALVGASVIVVTTVFVVVTLFPLATRGDQLATGAAVLGGIIGATGTAAAVYLALAAQRRDDADKVDATLRTEVAEFARMGLGALHPYVSLLERKLRPMPLLDLPALTKLPEPAVYLATADRLSRLPDGPLFVVFHNRIFELQQMAQLLAVTARPVSDIERTLDDKSAKTMLTGWHDVLELAATILTAGNVRHPMAAEAARLVVADIVSALSRAKPLTGPDPAEGRP